MSENTAVPFYVKVRTAAALLECSTKRVYQMIAEGKLRCTQLSPRNLRVDVASLKAWCEATEPEALGYLNVASAARRPSQFHPHAKLAKRVRG